MPRSRNLYKPNTDKPFKLSRTKIERFMNCPRCFYVDRVVFLKVVRKLWHSVN
jgi:hypothetical protein